MLQMADTLVVNGSVPAGFVLEDGKLLALWRPTEILIKCISASVTRPLQRLSYLPLVLLAAGLGGCAGLPGWFAASGPNASGLVHETVTPSPIPVVDIDDAVARRLLAAQAHGSFYSALQTASVAPEVVLGPGDVLAVTVWEAPPAVLFGLGVVAESGAAVSTSHATGFPEQMVAADGSITVPFAGSIDAAGKSPRQVEAEIAARLTGKANQPQVLVSVTHNATSNVTVVGEVTQSIRMPLTARGERILDALAAAGGVRQPLGKITIQLSRGDQNVAMALDSVIQDAQQNITLQRGDVLAALYQSLSFTALGAAGKNDEINFEAQGITLAQALGRIAGLQDARSDARGLFVFRFEDRALVMAGGKPLPMTPEGKVPVVYRLNLKDPRSFLAAQDFPMHNKDVVYVANAPSADLQKFLGILTSSVYSVYSLIHLQP